MEAGGLMLHAAGESLHEFKRSQNIGISEKLKAVGAVIEASVQSRKFVKVYVSFPYLVGSSGLANLP